jgi:hypothetical protein
MFALSKESLPFCNNPVTARSQRVRVDPALRTPPRPPIDKNPATWSTKAAPGAFSMFIVPG